MDLTKLTKQLILHEGLRLKMYVDSVGKVTIGVGHALKDVGLTHDQVMMILSNDIANTVNFLNAHLAWYVTLDDVRQRALADLTFDLMSRVLDFKKMLTAMQAKDWNVAADELLASKFAQQTGQRAKDLASMIRTGMDPS